MIYKRIFILGSGSSIGHSNNTFPSIMDFFSNPKKKDLKLYEINGYDQIAQYTKKTFGKDIEREKINIEDILTHVEIEIERNPSPELMSVKQSILFYIRKYLLKLSDMLSIQDGEYNKLIATISESDTIITYNWDILLDNLLGREYELKKRVYELSAKTSEFAYNDEITGIRRKTANRYTDFLQNYTALGEGTLGRLAVKQPYDQWDLKKGYFIKTHGSIDWLYCSNEACREYRKVLPLLKLDISMYCSACHESLDCLIIPPVLNKGYRNYPLIRVLWNLASIELAHADEIIVWGYSLPPTDFYSRWLLRQARKANLKRLVIINPSVIRIKNPEMKPNITFIKTFYDIYRDILPKVNVNNTIDLYENFNDYFSNRDIFTTYNVEKRLHEERYL